MLGFVRDKGGLHGIGKLLSARNGISSVEYFDSPDGPRLRCLSQPTSSLLSIVLPEQIRVFVYDPHRQCWRVGRADGRIDRAAVNSAEDQYHVRFANGHSARIETSDLFVRSDAAIDNAAEYLAARVNETPYFFDRRRQIVKHLVRQRNAFGGLTGLASSGIELLAHQVDASRRVLEDPIQRYLLADEVGLGKTIEAGIVIRQHVLDSPGTANVLVVVPDHVRVQWQSEMRSKFFLGDDAPIRIVGWEELDEDEDDDDVTLLVVDEAHRLALSAFDKLTPHHSRYEAVRRIATRVAKVVLLSGTPVLHQEAAFLAMLHLLDPAGYPLDSIDDFRSRVRGRQVVADALIDLTDEASAFFVLDAIERLEEAFPNDAALHALCVAARELSTEGSNSKPRARSLSSLRAYLTENYRLHRRLIRTRRDDARVRNLLPERAGTIVVEHDDPARAEAADFLDAWRQAVPAASADSATSESVAAASLFSVFVDAALSHPTVLLREINARLMVLGERRHIAGPRDQQALVLAEPLFAEEKGFLEARASLIKEATQTDCRITALADWLRSTDAKKAVVFIDDTAVADVVATELGLRLGDHRVFRYKGDVQLPEPFANPQRRAVIVCDASAEEGLNLQRHGAALLHFDLPLAPMRIEQRIGRIDRLEARGRFRNVVFASNCLYERAWLECLRQTTRVFNRSIAPLQYVLQSAVVQLRSRLLSEGHEAIAAVSEGMRSGPDSLDAELRRIRGQEAVDSLEMDAAAAAQSFKRLVREDAALEASGAVELESWIIDALHFSREQVRPNVVRYIHDLRRPTLIPLKDAIRAFRASLETSSQSRTALELPLRPATYNRYTAETSGVALLRVGHPFIDALGELMRRDDRGTCYVLWRCVPNLVLPDDLPALFLRFELLIDADIRLATENAPREVATEAIRRRADAVFTVQQRTIWLDRDLSHVTDNNLLGILNAKYSKSEGLAGSVDVNVTPDRWSNVDAALGTSDWKSLCHRGAEVAQRILHHDAELGALRQQSVDRVKRKIADSAAIVSSRLTRLRGPVKDAEERAAFMERQIDEALLLGLISPTMRIDAVGAVVLSRSRMVTA